MDAEDASGVGAARGTPRAHGSGGTRLAPPPRAAPRTEGWEDGTRIMLPFCLRGSCSFHCYDVAKRAAYLLRRLLLAERW